MCADSELGKKHASRWVTKAKIHESRPLDRTSRRERPMDIRSHLREAVAIREIIEATTVDVTPVSRPAKQRKRLRAYEALSQRFVARRRREDIRELQTQSA